jgi:hypothetical protein
VTAGIVGWHQPGDPGMSQLDMYTAPSAWVFARDDGSRLIARADAVWLDAGQARTGGGALPLLGTVQLAPGGAVLRDTGNSQVGLSPGIGYETTSLSADLGSTPLGFLLPNVVGGQVALA